MTVDMVVKKLEQEVSSTVFDYTGHFDFDPVSKFTWITYSRDTVMSIW